MTTSMSGDTDSRRVFLLLQTDPGRAVEAREFLRGTAGIADVAATSGPFDLIVTAEVAGTSSLEKLVGECRRAPGLTRLSRCQAVRS
jgi:hypothetical protein